MSDYSYHFNSCLRLPLHLTGVGVNVNVGVGIDIGVVIVGIIGVVIGVGAVVGIGVVVGVGVVIALFVRLLVSFLKHADCVCSGLLVGYLIDMLFGITIGVIVGRFARCSYHFLHMPMASTACHSSDTL